MSLLWSKRLHFRQVALMIVFSSFSWARYICPIIDYFDVAEEFQNFILSSWWLNNWSWIKYSWIEKEVTQGN